MISGSNAYIEVSPTINTSLIGEMIFSFYAGSTGALILKKRYPDDTVEVNGKLYLGFTQEDTVRLYNGSGNGEVEFETQVNFADSASVRQLPIKRLKLRRTRGAELVAGNAPRYDMPDEIVDIKTGDVVLLRGEKGDTAEFRYNGDILQWKYTHEDNTAWRALIDVSVVQDAVTRAEAALTAADKAEQAASAASSSAEAAAKSATVAGNIEGVVRGYHSETRSYGLEARASANSASNSADRAEAAAAQVEQTKNKIAEEAAALVDTALLDAIGSGVIE